MADNEYEAPLYSADVVDLFSSDRNTRKDYTYGFVIYACIMAAIFLVWASALIVLKLKGDRVGCASGKPFQTTVDDPEPSLPPRDSGSTELEEWVSSQSSGNDSDQQEEGVSIHGEYAIVNQRIDVKVVERNKKRQKRTRIVFLLAAVANLTCDGLLLAYCFNPIHETSARIDVFIDQTQEIIGQVNAAINSMSDAAEYSTSTVSSVSLDFAQFCPNIDPNVDLEVDLEYLSSVMQERIDELQNTVEQNITSAKSAVNGFQNGLDEFRAVIDSTEDKLWALPALLLCFCVVTTAAAFSLILVWRGRAGHCVNKGISKCVVPALIIFSVFCWTAAVASSVATIVSSDTCIAGPSKSPNATIQDVLSQLNVDQNSYLHTIVTAYSNGCTGKDPTQDFAELESSLQTAIATIWRHLSHVDSIGQTKLEQECGNSLEDLLAAARNLARGLTLIRKSLDSAITSLQCDNINPLYVEAVHEILCTEMANGVAWGYLLFSIASVCMMTMVTLRAGLYEAIVEEKVYAENEVADNMFLDEHEEYLAYISKYKHEWQEYDGINGRDINESADSVGAFAEAEADELSGPASIESVDGEEDVSIVEKMSDLEESWPFADEYESTDQVEESDDETASSYDADSIATDDISFLSLQTPVNQPSPRRQDALALPSLLPGIEGEEEEEDLWAEEEDPEVPIEVGMEIVPPPIQVPPQRDDAHEDDESPHVAAHEDDDSLYLAAPYSPRVRRGANGCFIAQADNSTSCEEREVHSPPKTTSSFGAMRPTTFFLPDPQETRDDVDTMARRKLIVDTRDDIEDEVRDSPSRESREVAWMDPPNSNSGPLEPLFLRNSRRHTFRPPTPPRRKTPKIRELITKFDDRKDP